MGFPNEQGKSGEGTCQKKDIKRWMQRGLDHSMNTAPTTTAFLVWNMESLGQRLIKRHVVPDMIDA
jgi:hypothetical protein